MTANRKNRTTEGSLSCHSIKSNGMSSTEELEPEEEDDPGEFFDLLVQVCPINLEKWPTMKLSRKLIAILKIPPVLALRLTVPLLDNSREDYNWNRLLVCIQCVTGPLFVSYISDYAFYMVGNALPGFVLVAAICILCAVMVFCTSDRFVPPVYHKLFAYLGFVVSVTWIYALASEIVEVLQIFGVGFNLSHAILGLSILAWGNSISGFLSNIAVARKDFSRMAIPSCFGGPLLALVLGLGIPCIIEIIKGRFPAAQPLKLSSEFGFLFVNIGIGLVMTASIMIAWKFPSRSRGGYGVFLVSLLISLYVAFVTLSVGVGGGNLQITTLK